MLQRKPRTRLVQYMTNIEIWKPIEEIPLYLYLDFIKEDHEGLSFACRCENSDDVLFIQFSSYVSYKNTDESFCLQSLDEIPLLSSEWPLFIAKESSYIDWLAEQNYKISEIDTLVHYIITHGDGIAEVISYFKPTVKWIK